MNGEEKFWMMFWATIVCGIVALSGIIACYSYNVQRVAFENGYEKAQLSSSTCTAWQKAE